MSNENVTVRNLQTGQVGVYSRRIFESLLSDKVFEEVKAGTKPYAKKTYKPRKPKETETTAEVESTESTKDEE